MFYYDVVILGNRTYRTFTYKYTEDIEIGKRVLVNFKNRRSIGVIIDKRAVPPLKTDILYKDIDLVIDKKALITSKDIELAFWTSERFISPISDILKLFFPPFSADNFRIKIKPLSDFLGFNKEIFLEDFMKAFKNRSEAEKILRNYIKMGLVKLELYEKRKRKASNRLFILKISPVDLLKQRMNEKLRNYLVKAYDEGNLISEEYMRKELKVSQSTIDRLIKKGILEEFNKSEVYIPERRVELTDDQKKVLNDILNSKERVHLLYGVTGSGKTEIYFEIMDKVLKKNKSILVVFPEISITEHIIDRFKKRFPNKEVRVYHSGTSISNRKEVWERAIEGKVDILVGTRSAIWIPINNLGLIVVDEEHDDSFYQFENVVYDAIEVLMKKSELLNVKLILSSATPRLREFYLKEEGKLQVHEIKERFKVEMPEVEIVDMRKEKKYRWIFSQKVLIKMKEVLEKGKKVLVFSPIKGYANYVICGDCGYVFKCKNCDISLTFHKANSVLKCHYCGYIQPIPISCPKCGSLELKAMGYGTERVVHELLRIFPDKKIVRIDREIIESREDLSNVMKSIKEKGAAIIVGTKIITKALDLPDLDLVIVLDSDRFLNLPDYSSVENATSLLLQVAGRSGRRIKGKVMIQSFNPDETIFEAVKNHDYNRVVGEELNRRRSYKYPPIYDMAILIFRSESKEKAKENAQKFFEKIKDIEEWEIYGPTEPSVFKIKGMYRYQITLKAVDLDRKKLLNIVKESQEKPYVYVNPPTTLII